jgi:Fe-S cluster assembly protein SufD
MDLGGAGGEAWQATFLDGVFCPDLSELPQSTGHVVVESLREAIVGGVGESLIEGQLGQLAPFKEDAFTALNTAFMNDGAVVEITRGHAVDRPIHLQFVSSGHLQIVQPRVLIVARAGSQATVVIDHSSQGEGANLCNAVYEVRVEENATLDIVLMQRENEASSLVSSLRARQARDSRLRIHTLTVGGGLVRNALDVVLDDSGAEADMHGLFLGTGERHIDNHTNVDHATPHCQSRELYKGVLADRSRGVFRGRVIVRPDAAKTNATQSNPNLLLSDDAEIDTRPQLEIRTDDVKCSHGSSIGRLDPDAVFYLQSRGLSREVATTLLTLGFATEVPDALPTRELARWARGLVVEQLQSTLGAGFQLDLGEGGPS